MNENSEKEVSELPQAGNCDIINANGDNNNVDQVSKNNKITEMIENINKDSIYPICSTPGPLAQDESSNDSTLHIILPPCEKKRKRSEAFDKEIEADITRELQRKSRKTSLTVKSVKDILRVS